MYTYDRYGNVNSFNYPENEEDLIYLSQSRKETLEETKYFLRKIDYFKGFYSTEQEALLAYEGSYWDNNNKERQNGS